MYLMYISIAFVLGIFQLIECDMKTTNSIQYDHKSKGKLLHLKTIPICCDEYTKANSSQGFGLQCEESSTSSTDTPDTTVSIQDKCVCEEGYKKMANNTCEPQCEQNCGNNSACVAPNQCIDDDAYIYLQNCNESICGFGGECKGDICTCQQEYKVDQACHPTCCQIPCTEPCNNRTCFEGKCVCPDGYVDLNSTCDARCSKDCGYGYCVAPETCECYSGYSATESDPVCQSNCQNCQNNCNEWDKCPQEDSIFDGETYCFKNCSDGFDSCESPTNCLPEDFAVNNPVKGIGTWTYVWITLCSIIIASLVVLLIIKRQTALNYFRKGSYYNSIENIDESAISTTNTLDSMRLSNLVLNQRL